MKRIWMALMFAALAAGGANAQYGTTEEQAARRGCWESMLGNVNASPTNEQIVPLNNCIKKALGRQDPYMKSFLDRARAAKAKK